MKICEKHFEVLKTAIAGHGLADFVKPPEEAAANYQRIAMRQGEPAQDNFCPLFYAQVLLYNQFIQATGGACLSYQPEEWQPPHQCPACEAEAHEKHDWIKNAAQDSAKFFLSLPPKARPPFKSGCQVIAETLIALSQLPYWQQQSMEQWAGSQLATAADCYLVANKLLDSGFGIEALTKAVGKSWPFDGAAFTPSESKFENLAKAGAFIAIELGRLNRIEVEAKSKH